MGIILRFSDLLRGALFKYRQFLYGRYGQDRLNRFISYLALALCAISFIIRTPILSISIFALFGLSLFRSMSKNHNRRRRENQIYETASRPAKRFFKYWFVRIKSRKTHMIYTCGKCRSILRVPKDAPQGRLEIRCPKCGDSFTRRVVA